MSITSAIVLLAVIWFMVLLVTLPLRFKSQGDVGDVTPGTPASAPAELRLGRIFLIVTLVSLPIWIGICAIILSGWITLADFDLFHRFGPQD
jgi:predicted secreted protein